MIIETIIEEGRELAKRKNIEKLMNNIKNLFFPQSD
jgi:hypothetical protein